MKLLAHKRNVQFAAFSLTAGMLASAFATPASATTIQNFDAPGTSYTGVNYPAPNVRAAPGVAGPDAFSTGQYLNLLSGGLYTRTQNSVGFDTSDSGAYNHIIADFDFRITCSGARNGFGGGGCADGFSFLLLDTAVHGSTGAPQPTQAEFGALSLNGQLAFNFSTYGVNSNKFSMLANGAWVPGAVPANSTVPFDLATGLYGNEGAFHHANIDLLLGAIPTVTVNLTDGISGSVYTPFSNFALPVSSFGATEKRVGFVARCGDACAEYDIDNINISFQDPVQSGSVPEPATLALMGIGLAGLGFRRKKLAK